MAGLTGGIQGGTATFAGYTYPAGGVVDRVFKAFGGTHDYIGGQVTGLYDDHGNTRQGRSDAEKLVHETWSAVAIAPSTPLAMAELLPPEAWKAISILLGIVK
jgi:filamentous hemagglutinin